MRKPKTYALYTKDDELVIVGTAAELAFYLGRTVQNMRHAISKVKCGETKTINGKELGKLKIYEIED